LINQRGPYIQPPHADTIEIIEDGVDCLGYKTLLYYVNDSDGDTIFYNECFTGQPVGLVTEQQRVTPKKGRAVIFNSNQIHSGSCPSVNDSRIVINCVFGI
jgi:Rps23 Pro-64 3,4-dihydroxylase Tpa1-like proline 4-hydroxylase